MMEDIRTTLQKEFVNTDLHLWRKYNALTLSDCLQDVEVCGVAPEEVTTTIIDPEMDPEIVNFTLKAVAMFTISTLELKVCACRLKLFETTQTAKSHLTITSTKLALRWKLIGNSRLYVLIFVSTCF